MYPEETRTPEMTLAQKVVMSAVIVMALLVVAGLSAPVLLKSRRATDRTEALNNIKQISTMLFEFDSEYGNFPDDDTAQDVKETTKTDFVLSGPYSNDYFRQMLADPKGGKSEKPFWGKSAFSPKKNHKDDFSTPAKALEAGEVGFSYIMASATKGQSSSGDPLRPVVVTPSYRGQESDWAFDPEIHAGKAVVLRLDNSATPLQIREDNKKVSIGGPDRKTLGDLGEGTVWGKDMKPVLRAPHPR